MRMMSRCLIRFPNWLVWENLTYKKILGGIYKNVGKLLERLYDFEELNFLI